MLQKTVTMENAATVSPRRPRQQATEAERFMLPTHLIPDDVQPGTNVLVSGPSGRGARDVALQLVFSELAPDEAVILLSADVGGRSLLQRVEKVAGPIDRTRIGVVDCSGRDDEQERFEEHVEAIDGPGDLMSIKMEFSVLYETLVERGYDRVNLGVFSVASLLAHADLQSVSRFVHMLTGRVITTDDVGVFVVDASMQDDRTVDAIERYCDVSVDVRDDASEGRQFRTRGPGPRSSSWAPISEDCQAIGNDNLNSQT